MVSQISLSPIIYIITPILLASIINLIIFRFKWNTNKQQMNNPYLPPGYIIGIIWIIIFGLLGYVYYLLFSKSHILTVGTISIILMVFFCLLYPFLTRGFHNELVSDILNKLTFLFSIIVGIIVYIENKTAFIYVIPLILWSFYVNVIFYNK